MSIKRDELDILEMAIKIANVKAYRECQRDKLIEDLNSKIKVCFKKEISKQELEHKLSIVRQEGTIDRYNEEIHGLNEQLNLLRWLYNDRVVDCEVSNGG